MINKDDIGAEQYGFMRRGFVNDNLSLYTCAAAAVIAEVSCLDTCSARGVSREAVGTWWGLHHTGSRDAVAATVRASEAL